MRLLFVGGTRFSGLAAAQQALARGHQVDVFHRGQSKPSGLHGARELVGDRNADLSALATGEWDAVIDMCAYRPGEIHRLADRLAGRAPRYVLVSSVSAYADDIPHRADESATLADTSVLDAATLDTVPIDGATYGPLKVLVEQAARQRHRNLAIVRPAYIIGPHDPTPRFPEWVRRIAGGGRVVAPGPRDAAVQYVDARDLAAFMLDLAERGPADTFNVAATQGLFTFGELLDGIAAGVAPAGTTLEWISADEAREAGQEWPLWHGGDSLAVATTNTAKAHAAGLQCRPLPQSAADTLAWLRAR